MACLHSSLEHLHSCVKFPGLALLTEIGLGAGFGSGRCAEALATLRKSIGAGAGAEVDVDVDVDVDVECSHSMSAQEQELDCAKDPGKDNSGNCVVSITCGGDHKV